MTDSPAPARGRPALSNDPSARGAIAALVMVLLLAGAGAWLAWQVEGPLASIVALVAGGAAVGLVARLAWRSWADARALGDFAQRLRDGDVAGALRAVRAHSPQAVSAWGPLSTGGPAGHSSAPPSQFDQHAREVEVALGEREKRWQARMRLSADWHWETDAELRITWVSQDLASLVKLGLKPADLIGHRLDAVPQFEKPEGGWGPVMERAQQHKSLRDVVLEVHRRGLSSVWISLTGRAHFDAQGRFTGYEGVGRDVTEARIAHLRLAESERRHAMMAELAADWYWRTDEQHRVSEIGPVARQQLGAATDRVLGRPRWEAFADGTSPAHWAAHQEELAAHRPFRGFEYAQRYEGITRWVSISGVPRFDARGQFLGYHGVGRDITLRKRAEALLLSRNEQLERLVTIRTSELEQTNRDLEAFSRQLAHELRTPISQIIGLSDLLKSAAWERLADNEREWLRLAGQSAREMSHTVTALLELARSTSTALLLEPVDLSALAESVIGELPWLERPAPVDWRIEPGLSAHCSAPLARVALTNLLGNAAKFTRDVEQPVVSFEREPGDDGAFAVQDNGAGFDAAAAGSLFQPFVRLHPHEQFHGTGLGLSIVRRIVERHGGSIRAQGEPGRGARFVFRFNAVRAGQAAQQVNDAAA